MASNKLGTSYGGNPLEERQHGCPQRGTVSQPVVGVYHDPLSIMYLCGRCSKKTYLYSAQPSTPTKCSPTRSLRAVKAFNNKHKVAAKDTRFTCLLRCKIRKCIVIF